MIFSQIYCECALCNKDIKDNGNNFNNHIGTHYNPIGRNCLAWYKDYFKRDENVCVCKICDREFFHENKNGIGASIQYERHLEREHDIKRR